MDTEPFFDRLHPEEIRRRQRMVRRRRTMLRLRHYGRYGLVLLLAICLWATAHIYYYNKLIDMEFDIQAAWAQVEVQWQRRYHIQQNLTRLVLEYAKHERQLMLRLTRMRTGRKAEAGTPDVAPGTDPGPAPGTDPGQAGGAPAQAAAKLVQQAKKALSAKALAQLKAQMEQLGPAELNRLFPSIQVAAEQYPALRLTENFQQFSKAIVETETTIAGHIESYNKAVNDYTTMIKQFPAVVFAKTCGFKNYAFYRPGRDTLKFRPVETRIDS